MSTSICKPLWMLGKILAPLVGFSICMLVIGLFLLAEQIGWSQVFAEVSIVILLTIVTYPPIGCYVQTVALVRRKEHPGYLPATGFALSLALWPASYYMFQNTTPLANQLFSALS